MLVTKVVEVTKHCRWFEWLDEWEEFFFLEMCGIQKPLWPQSFECCWCAVCHYTHTPTHTLTISWWLPLHLSQWFTINTIHPFPPSRHHTQDNLKGFQFLISLLAWIKQLSFKYLAHIFMYRLDEWPSVMKFHCGGVKRWSQVNFSVSLTEIPCSF